MASALLGPPQASVCRLQGLWAPRASSRLRREGEGSACCGLTAGVAPSVSSWLLASLLPPFLHFLLLETLLQPWGLGKAQIQGRGLPRLDSPPPHHLCLRLSCLFYCSERAFFSRRGGGGGCFRESRVIHTKGRGNARNPRCRGRHPSLSAGLGASCLCSRPSHSPRGGNQGDLLRPSRQESKTQPHQKKEKPPRARPSLLRCRTPSLKKRPGRQLGAGESLMLGL